MSNDPWLMLGTGLAAFGLSGPAVLLLYVLFQAWRRRARPSWPAMREDTEHFHQSMVRIFHARGYRVKHSWIIQDRIERQAREVVLALNRRGVPYVALCGRWVVPITSEVVTRFEDALARTQAQQGMIVTTSYFTEAARQRAAGYPVELVDGDELQRWMDKIW